MRKRIIATASTDAPPPSGVTIKTARELEAMRRAGKVVARVLRTLRDSAQPGMRTRDLDAMAARIIREEGAIPTFKGYRGFPAVICTSVNEEIVHGIPGDRVLKDGDLLKIDAGATVDGFVGDAAITVGVGRISPEAQALLETTRDALEEGIKQCWPGKTVGDVGATVQRYAESRGYGVVREYVGHGIGRAMHEDPQVPNYGVPGRGVKLREGMAICIEPMVNIGDWRTRVLKDRWTVVTLDGTLSSHFEHTVAITGQGPEVLTRSE